MYKVKTNNKTSKKITNKVDFVNLDGFLMPSKKQYFIINSERIKDIKVVDNELIKAMVSKKVKAKYKRLIAKITELFLDEDGDEAGNMSEVLNRIEKFRQEIKYKYRSYLEKKEISLMAKQLRNLQKRPKNVILMQLHIHILKQREKIDKLLINRTYLFVYI